MLHQGIACNHIVLDNVIAPANLDYTNRREKIQYYLSQISTNTSSWIRRLTKLAVPAGVPGHAGSRT